MPSSGGKFILSPFRPRKTYMLPCTTVINFGFALLSLRQCSMMRSALFKGQSLDDDILNALKVRIVHCSIFSSLTWIPFRSSHRCLLLQMDCVASEHPAVISPCLTILEKLSNQYYTELKTDVQVSLNGLVKYKCSILLLYSSYYISNQYVFELS